MAVNSFETLKKKIEANSVAGRFYQAVNEWTVTAVEEEPTGDGECICGQQELRYMYTIENPQSGRTLRYIGSTCVQHFESKDLDLQVSVFRELFELQKKFRANKAVEMNADYFSRESLKWLHQEKAFPATQYNGQDGANDYQFLLDMFNKHHKEDITSKQRGKINGLISYQIRPMVLDHPALGS